MISCELEKDGLVREWEGANDCIFHSLYLLYNPYLIFAYTNNLPAYRALGFSLPRLLFIAESADLSNVNDAHHLHATYGFPRIDFSLLG